MATRSRISGAGLSRGSGNGVAARAIPFQSQCRLTIHYKGEPLHKEYIADLICFGQIIAELKACERLTGSDEAQILNYLKATGKRAGLLFNFGSPVKLVEVIRNMTISVGVVSCDFVDPGFN